MSRFAVLRLRHFLAFEEVILPGDQFSRYQVIGKERRKAMTEGNFNLTVIWTNSAPQRESTYPRTWTLHTQSGRAVELHVVFDSASRPRVLDKGAA